MKQVEFKANLIAALQDPEVQEAVKNVLFGVAEDDVTWTKIDKAFEGLTDLFKDLPKGTYTTKTTRTTRS